MHVPTGVGGHPIEIGLGIGLGILPPVGRYNQQLKIEEQHLLLLQLPN